MINKIFDRIVNIPAENYAFHHLKQDNLFDKIDKEEFGALIQSALECGKKLAQNISIKYPNKTIIDILNELQINLQYKDFEIDESYTLLGCFQTPNQIFINKKLIDFAEKFLLSKGIVNIKNSQISDLIIAHELFHYFQENDDSLFVNTHKIKLWKVGFFKHYSTLGSLSEIAAMSFAQEFNKSVYFSTAIELLLLFPYYPDKVELIVDQLEKYSVELIVD